MPFAFLAAAGAVAAWYMGKTGQKGGATVADVLAGALSSAGSGAVATIPRNYNPLGSSATAQEANYASPAEVKAVLDKKELPVATTGITAGPALAVSRPAASYTPLPDGATIAQAMQMQGMQESPAALASFQALSLLGGSVSDNYAAAMSAAANDRATIPRNYNPARAA